MGLLQSRVCTVLVFSIFVAAAHAQTTYKLDDGSGNINIGPSFAAEMLWGNYFYTQPGAHVITEVQVGFGSYAVGAPVTLYVFDDPDMDGDPGNAIPLATVSGLTASTGQAGFAQYAVPDTAVSGAFFVAAMVPVVPPNDRPARIDPQSSGVQSWFFANGTINPSNLGASPFILRMDQAPFPGAWMVRAIAVPTPSIGVVLLGIGMLAMRGRR